MNAIQRLNLLEIEDRCCGGCVGRIEFNAEHPEVFGEDSHTGSLCLAFRCRPAHIGKSWSGSALGIARNAVGEKRMGEQGMVLVHGSPHSAF
jgi:hypothetical protein